MHVVTKKYFRKYTSGHVDIVGEERLYPSGVRLQFLLEFEDGKFRKISKWLVDIYISRDWQVSEIVGAGPQFAIKSYYGVIKHHHMIKGTNGEWRREKLHELVTDTYGPAYRALLLSEYNRKLQE